MARDLANKTNVIPAGGDYPYGRIKDNPGDGTGTPVNELLYGDIHQFFAKLFAESGLTYNNQPDNDYSGFQFYDALLAHLQSSWASYIPALTANDGSIAIVGGFTGTVDGKWMHDTFRKILYIKMRVTSVTTLNTVKFLTFSLPPGVTVAQPYNAEGFALVKYYNGSVYTTKQVKIALRWNGSGTGLEVSSFDESFFGNDLNGTIDFSIAIGFREDGA